MPKNMFQAASSCVKPALTRRKRLKSVKKSGFSVKEYERKNKYCVTLPFAKRAFFPKRKYA